jgi:hypothetical protein
MWTGVDLSREIEQTGIVICENEIPITLVKPEIQEYYIENRR